MMFRHFAFFSVIAVSLFACSPTVKTLTKTVERSGLTGSTSDHAHVGISIIDATTGDSLYAYNDEKYFTPASNIKLVTLYAALKYLRDSLPGIQYHEKGDTLFVFPTGDPTFLQPEFKQQPVVPFLQKSAKKVVVVTNAWQDNPFGSGWAWNDYNEEYMPERSLWPVYGNVIRWNQGSQRNTQPEVADSLQYFIFSDPEVNWKVRFKEDRYNQIFSVLRRKDENFFQISQGKEARKQVLIPFITNGVASALELLKDTIGKEIVAIEADHVMPSGVINSQPLDSVLQKTMYRSDNFYAEQLLLMVSQQKLGKMNDRAIIDTLLKSDLAGMPQKASWVDGSGLSRYNLFTPRDFTWLLKKMKDEFTLERLKRILPGAGTGTLARYYIQDSGFIYAKTGTLSGQVCLSGYLVSNRNRALIFSVLVNNHNGSATEIRRSVEAFLHEVRKKY